MPHIRLRAGRPSCGCLAALDESASNQWIAYMIELLESNQWIAYMLQLLDLFPGAQHGKSVCFQSYDEIKGGRCTAGSPPAEMYLHSQCTPEYMWRLSNMGLKHEPRHALPIQAPAANLKDRKGRYQDRDTTQLDAKRQQAAYQSFMVVYSRTVWLHSKPA